MTPAELRRVAAATHCEFADDALRAAADIIEALQRREAEWDGYDEMHAKLTAKIAEKDAEIERLKKQNARLCERIAGLEPAPLDEDFTAREAERDAALAEVTKLSAHIASLCEAEVRAALEERRGGQQNYQPKSLRALRAAVEEWLVRTSTLDRRGVSDEVRAIIAARDACVVEEAMGKDDD